MRLTTAVVALSFASLCLLSSPAAHATGITVGDDYYMTVENYPSPVETNGQFSVGDTTVNIYADNFGSKGALLATYVDDAFCIDFQDEIRTPDTYLVVAQGVGSAYESSLGGPSDATLKLEAALGYQFDGHQSNDATVQDAIWDQSGAHYSSSAISSAIATANTYTGGYIGDIAFEEVSNWWGADGQSFMVDLPQTPPQNVPPPATTPEPSSLMLLGTGMIGMVAVMRRRLQPVKA